MFRNESMFYLLKHSARQSDNLKQINVRHLHVLSMISTSNRIDVMAATNEVLPIKHKINVRDEQLIHSTCLKSSKFRQFIYFLTYKAHFS